MLVTTPTVYEAFRSRHFAGLGITDARARFCLGWGPGQPPGPDMCSQQEFDDAMELIYPYRTESGELVQRESVESGGYRLEGSEEGGYTAIAVSGANAGPKPELEDIPLYQYIPDSSCDPRDLACLEANTQIMRANKALQENRLAEYRNRIREHNCALNTTAGHPEHCEPLEPLAPVPSAPGTPVQTAGYYTGEYPAAGPETGILLDQPLPVQPTAPSYSAPAYSAPRETQTVSSRTTAVSAQTGSQAEPESRPSEEAAPGIVESFTGAVSALDPTVLLIAAGVGAFLLLRK